MKKLNFFFMTTLLLIIFTNVSFAQWNLSGNSIASGDFIGTLNTQDLVFKTINTERMRIKNVDGDGFVGINNNNPQAWLDINCTWSNWIRFSTINSNDAWVFHNPLSGDFLIGFTVDGINYNYPLSIQRDGKVVIGNVTIPNGDGYKLYVETGILTEKVKVAIKSTGNWSDYVFDNDYKIMSLYELEKFILKNKHLPNIPSATEVVNNGVDLAKMDALLLAKIEELTLYIIQLKNQYDKLQDEINRQKVLK